MKKITSYNKLLFAAFLVFFAGMTPKAVFFRRCRWNPGFIKTDTIGVVLLQGEKSENVDVDCLMTALASLVSAVDNHQVSYLKMIISSDDEIVRQILAAPHLWVQRGAASKDSLLVSLGPAPPYFLSVTGKAMYSAGLMVDGLVLWKCVKVKAQ